MYTQDLFNHVVALTRHELAQRILNVLAKEPGLKARAIAYRIGTQINQRVQRHDVNSILYSELRFKVRKSENDVWYLLADFPTPKAQKVRPTIEPKPTAEKRIPEPAPAHAKVNQPLPVNQNHPKLSAGQLFIGALVVTLLAVLLTRGTRRENLIDKVSPPEATITPALDLIPEVIYDTLVVEKTSDKVDPLIANTLLSLYRNIIELEKDTAEIGQGIKDMQNQQDAGIGEYETELKYAMGYLERVRGELVQKQDSIGLLTMHIEK